MAQEHGVESTVYDNLGNGWRMRCLCGFETCPDIALMVVGEEMDDHFYDSSRSGETV